MSIDPLEAWQPFSLHMVMMYLSIGFLVGHVGALLVRGTLAGGLSDLNGHWPQLLAVAQRLVRGDARR